MLIPLFFFVDVALGDVVGGGPGSDEAMMMLKVFFNLNNKKDNYCVHVIEPQNCLGWEGA